MSLEDYKSQKFEEMTTKLKSALREIGQNPTIPATQDSIVRLTGCGRRLLSTPARKWVMDDLGAIKRERLQRVAEPDEIKSSNTLMDVGALKELLEKQNKRIEVLHVENSELFEEVRRLESENRTLNEENVELKRKSDGKFT
ncbi:hypothetical protein [Burkholderia pseudomallei]|uniref:hypothetical protein n=1 Tax=Burkholderia pseudomallei TaxID=28450 RepID=UPI001AD64C66|nr:hypothetical protein [Burkholderia pseudomallei]MBO7749315.1 hypothetical protein [Burkholderia pseudomallei]